MRKITSKREEEKKKRKNQLIVGGILIGVMLVSVMGYALQNNFTNNSAGSSNSTTVTYNGLNFINQNGFWVLKGNNGKTFVFTYNPSEIPQGNLGNISMSTNSLAGKQVHIYSYNQFAESELQVNLKNIASEVINENQTLQNPNCNLNSIIVSNGTLGATQKGNCVYIFGQGEDLIKLADNVLFKIMGIRNG